MSSTFLGEMEETLQCRLKDLLSLTGTGPSEFSRAVGRLPSYATKLISYRRMNLWDVENICRVFGIPMRVFLSPGPQWIGYIPYMREIARLTPRLTAAQRRRILVILRSL